MLDDEHWNPMIGIRNKTNLSISIALIGLYCLWSLLVNRSFSPTLPRINNQIKVFEMILKKLQMVAVGCAAEWELHLFSSCSFVWDIFMRV